MDRQHEHAPAPAGSRANVESEWAGAGGPVSPLLALQRSIGNSATAALLRRTSPEAENDDERTAGSPGAEAPPIVYDVLHRHGAPLDHTVRALMEPRLGTNLDAVRIHTDARSQESAAAVGARAYTVGRDIVFGAPGFNAREPNSLSTLAHELTHTVQNGSGAWSGEPLELDHPDTPEERAAGDVGRMMQGDLQEEARVGAISGRRSALARQPTAMTPPAEATAPATGTAIAATSQRAAYPGAPTKAGKAAAGEVLSAELSDAPGGATPAERVFKWLQAHAAEIATQEARFGVDRRAIAGAIAWEALENPHGLTAALGGRFVGAGKPHVKDSFVPAVAQTGENVPQEVEEAGLLPRRSIIERELALRKDSIPYVAAGMRLATDIGRAYGHDIATDPAMLTWFWQGKDANKFIAYLSAKEGSEFDTTQQAMPTWVTENLAWLESAVGRCDLKPHASLPKAGTMETASWHGEYTIGGRLPETREFLVNGGRVDVTIDVDTDIVAAFGYPAYVVLHRRQEGADVEIGDRRVDIGKTSKVTWEKLKDGIYFLEIFSLNGVQVEGHLQVDLAPRRPQGGKLQRQAADDAPDSGATAGPPDPGQLRADAARELVAELKAKNIKYGHNWADEKHTARSDDWWWDDSEFDCSKFVLWVLAGRKLGDPWPDGKQPKQAAIHEIRAGSLGAVDDASSVSAMTSIVEKRAAEGATKPIEKRAPKVGDLIFWTTHVGIVVELTVDAKGETFLVYANATRPGQGTGADLTGINEKGQHWLKVTEIPTNRRLAGGAFLGYWSP